MIRFLFPPLRFRHRGEMKTSQTLAFRAVLINLAVRLVLEWNADTVIAVVPSKVKLKCRLWLSITRPHSAGQQPADDDYQHIFNAFFLFLLIAASTTRSYLYGVQVGQCRVLPSTTQIKSFVFVSFCAPGTDENCRQRNWNKKKRKVIKTKEKNKKKESFHILKVHHIKV